MTKALPAAQDRSSPTETLVVALLVSSEPAQSRPEHQTECIYLANSIDGSKNHLRH